MVFMSLDAWTENIQFINLLQEQCITLQGSMLQSVEVWNNCGRSCLFFFLKTDEGKLLADKYIAG